jgi:hypothetical protein
LAENELSDKSNNPFAGNYRAYYNLVKPSKEQSQMHGDRYDENRPYSISSQKGYFITGVM